MQLEYIGVTLLPTTTGQSKAGAGAVEMSPVSQHNLAFIHRITITPVLLKLAAAQGTSHAWEPPTCLPHCPGAKQPLLGAKLSEPRGQRMEGR